MTRRCLLDDQSTRGCVCLVLAFALVAALGCSRISLADSEAAPIGEAIAAPRPTMRLVFEEMTTLLPLALDESRWSAPATQSQVLAGLERLDVLAGVIERHGRSREAGFDELALSLGRDLSAARDHYAAGLPAEARFFFTGSLQSCVSCHVRLPSDRDFDLADAMTEQVEIEALDPRERAWLFVLARRFDDALGIWEALLADPERSPARLDASGVLVDYLNVVLRVRTDVERARQVLTTFAAREDLPLYLRGRVDGWRTALDAIGGSELVAETPASVARGERLARRGAERARGPHGRDGLIQDLAAASQLVRFLEDDRARALRANRNRTPAERGEQARAYFWLATVEARSLDGFWINLADRHLEAAIRAAPKSEWAKRAYTQLEETQVLGHGGSSGHHLPPDVWTRLRELRELMGLDAPASPDFPNDTPETKAPERARGERP